MTPVLCSFLAILNQNELRLTCKMGPQGDQCGLEFLQYLLCSPQPRHLVALIHLQRKGPVLLPMLIRVPFGAISLLIKLVSIQTPLVDFKQHCSIISLPIMAQLFSEVVSVTKKFAHSADACTSRLIMTSPPIDLGAAMCCHFPHCQGLPFPLLFHHRNAFIGCSSDFQFLCAIFRSGE